MRIGYLRVSTLDQSTNRQIDGLEALCDTLDIEKASAAGGKKRPVFDAVIKKLKPGDTLVVWNLDRAFRSALHAIQTAEALRARGIHFQIVSMMIDTSTPEGEFQYAVTAAAAQLERRLLSRRTREGMAAAKKRGVKFGRKRVLDETAMRKARSLIKRGVRVEDAAAQLGASRATLYRYLAA